MQSSAWTDRRANALDHLHVALRILADLDLDRLHTFRDDLCDFLLASSNPMRPMECAAGIRLADRAAKQAIYREPPLPSRQVIGGHFDRRLGVRVALDYPIHALVQLDELTRAGSL